jgi:sulfur relay protein TusB/DsrH
MKPILMLISSSPDTPEARQALELAKSLWEGGNELGIFFIQDGVYHTVNPSGSQEILSEGKVPRYCLTEDLEMRGFGAQDVILPVKLSDYDELVDLMMEGFDSAIGAF